MKLVVSDCAVCVLCPAAAVKLPYHIPEKKDISTFLARSQLRRQQIVSSSTLISRPSWKQSLMNAPMPTGTIELPPSSTKSTAAPVASQPVAETQSKTDTKTRDSVDHMSDVEPSDDENTEQTTSASEGLAISATESSCQPASGNIAAETDDCAEKQTSDENRALSEGDINREQVTEVMLTGKMKQVSVEETNGLVSDRVVNKDESNVATDEKKSPNDCEKLENMEAEKTEPDLCAKEISSVQEHQLAIVCEEPKKEDTEENDAEVMNTGDKVVEERTPMKATDNETPQKAETKSASVPRKLYNVTDRFLLEDVPAPHLSGEMEKVIDLDDSEEMEENDEDVVERKAGVESLIKRFITHASSSTNKNSQKQTAVEIRLLDLQICIRCNAIFNVVFLVVC